MKKLFVHRILAFVVDWFIIIIYASLLFLVAYLISGKNLSATEEYNPYRMQLIGFMTLTLQVFLYSYLTEKSKWKATIGKRILKLRVAGTENKTTGNIFLRNLFKYLPWEIAHTGVHWVVYFNNSHLEPPVWVWILLIVPQLIVIVYLISALFSGG